jgi:hypothetical protein
MTGETPNPITPTINQAGSALFSQIMSVMGFQHPGWIARCLYPIFHTPIMRISRLFVELDQNIPRLGWNVAVNHFLENFVTRLNLDGVGNLPTHGPLMVVSNHPAALDVVILSAAIKRDDLKILASDIPFVQIFPHIREHSIPVHYDLALRLSTVRRAIRHLDEGGAILIFPRGNVEPDPAVSPGAEDSLEGWSTSIELFLRKVPQTISVVAIASGMLSTAWYKNPFIQLWKNYEQRQKVAEIFQVASQLITGKTPALTPSLSFSPALTIADLGGEDSQDGALMTGLTAHMRALLAGTPSLLT